MVASFLLFIFLDVRVYHIVNRNLGGTQGCIQFVNKRNLPVVPAMICLALTRIANVHIGFSIVLFGFLALHCFGHDVDSPHVAQVSSHACCSP